MPTEIKPITEAPEFVAPLSEKVNEIAAALKPLLNLKPGKGIKITVSQSDISISIDDNVGGGGLPAGYVETAITLCVDGVETPGTILFKATPPPP